jgi:hypothetical protein
LSSAWSEDITNTAWQTAEMTLTKCLAGVAVVTGAILAACESSSAINAPSAPSGPDASFDSGSPGDSSPATPDSAALEDASQDAAPADPFAGVWLGLQGGETIEISNAAGCTVMKGTVNSVVCDECVGTYVPGDAGAASVVANCKPLAACSVSPPHTNTGTFTRGDGGALTFFYDYGGGTASVEVQPTPGTAGDVCRIVDAGGGD